MKVRYSAYRVNLMSNDEFLRIGKLRHVLLDRMLNKFVSDLSLNDTRVVLGSKIGEDAAVIDMGDKYLIAKTDPITFATEEIGYYAVNVNVNDVVCMGAEPKWFQSTILLPEKNTTEEKVKHIFKNIHDTCKSMGIAIIGGHTEVTSGLDKPIVVGLLLGEVDKSELITTSGAEVGDSIILTKGIFIEGTSIIAREKEFELKEKGFSEEFIKTSKEYLYDPGISVYKEARLVARDFKIKSMHDPTEGGLSCGIAEIALASNTGALIQEEKITVLPEPLKLSQVFNLNPLGTISSGSLLIVCNEEDTRDIIEVLEKNNIKGEKIGVITSKDEGLQLKKRDGKISPLLYSESDEITKIFF